jgi:hypothetical protein
MKTPDPARYRQDGQGQWWFTLSDGRSARATEHVCQHCREPFVAYKKTQKFCSHACNALAMVREPPLTTPVEALPSDELFNSHDPRYSRDARGQWWYANDVGQRARCSICQCSHCERRFLTKSARQKYCGHACCAAATAAKRPRTTNKRSAPGSGLRHSDNPRYSQDENGQWWYTPEETSKRQYRTRAYVMTCKRCNGEFLASIWHRKNVDFCSRGCAKRHFADNNPGYSQGENGGNWKGGRQIDSRGYVLIWAPAHPSRTGQEKPYVFEHRLVVEKRLDRVLLPHENIHHINGDRADNADSNLELWSTAQPCGQRVEDKMKWVWEMAKLYRGLYPEPA